MSAQPVGVVLAGGAGRRIGGDKARVALLGRPLLHYPLEALRVVLDEVVVVCKTDTPLPPLPAPVSIWCENDPEHHPLIGVAAALREARGRPVLVCAGDMPLVTPEAVRALLTAPAATAVVTRIAGRVQPLFARYSPAAVAMLDAMDLSEPATRVVERLDPHILDLDDDDLALNVNAPEDILQASALLHRR